MLGTTDLTKPHEIEQLRRSVAMLTTGAPVFNREDGIRLLQALHNAVQHQR